ncbi:MAG: bifunctional 3'-5' exonuclease/DNA polymerase [Desertifilum sp.]|nr:bifunctional 3'-5' exonuclease/DNA polymerase [Desertifilum sp.]
MYNRLETREEKFGVVDLRSTPNYRFIRTNAEALEAIAKLGTPKIMGLDTETTGLDPLSDRLRLLQIAVPKHPVLVIDLFSVELGLFAELLTSDAEKVLHNAKFDFKFLKSNGVELTQPIRDTMLASQLLNAGMRNVNHKLSSLVERYFRIPMDKEQQLSDFSKPELDPEQLDYAAKDVAVLPILWKMMQPEVELHQLTHILEIECRTIPAVADMELSGIRLDIQKWESLGDLFRDRLTETEVKIHGFLKPNSPQTELLEGTNKVDINSPKQLKAALKGIGIKVSSTGIEVMKAHVDEHPVIDLIIEYRHYSKRLSSFLDAFVPKLNPVSLRIHANFWQTGSDAGRFSSSNPNLQQIPRTKDFRQCFIPGEGNVFCIADYSQIELRIAAEIANETRMIEAYIADADLHSLTASLVSGKKIEEVTKNERQMGKPVNFGLIYGMGADGLKDYAFNSYGVVFSLEESKSLRDKYFEAYSNLKVWHQRVSQQRMLSNRIETRTLGGRRRIFDRPDVTKLLNTPVQGTGADMVKLALSLLYEEPLREYLGYKFIAVIHDEIILEVSAENAEVTKHLLQEKMEEAGRYYLKVVPVVAEAKIADSWGEK